MSGILKATRWNFYVLTQPSDKIKKGVGLATEAIDSGMVLKKLEQMIKVGSKL